MTDKEVENLIFGKDDSYSIEEICKILKVGKYTAYGIARNPELNCYRLSNKWVIPKTALVKWLSNRIHS